MLYCCDGHNCFATFETQCGYCWLWEARAASWWVKKNQAFCPTCTSLWPSAADELAKWRRQGCQEDGKICESCKRKYCNDIVQTLKPSNAPQKPQKNSLIEDLQCRVQQLEEKNEEMATRLLALQNYAASTASAMSSSPLRSLTAISSEQSLPGLEEMTSRLLALETWATSTASAVSSSPLMSSTSTSSGQSPPGLPTVDEESPSSTESSDAGFQHVFDSR